MEEINMNFKTKLSPFKTERFPSGAEKIRGNREAAVIGELNSNPG